MSASNIGLPSFQQACLAADNANSAVYLVGVSTTTPERLEAHYIPITSNNNLLTPPNSKLIASQIDPTSSWTSNSPKACFTYPSPTSPATSVMVVQFEPYKTQLTSFRVSDAGMMDVAKNLTNLAFVSPRLFSLSGYFGASILTNYPTRTPLFALGTYTSSLSTATQGYSIVFDTTGQGQAYPALGNAAPVLGSHDHILSLGSPYSVNLNGVTLTMDAVPVTMANTGYILDKGSDGSTVVYSITPDQSSMLHRISLAGGPPFSPFMVATALNKQIVTYSSNNSPLGSMTGPILNIFDTITGTWSGPGLMDGFSPSSTAGLYPGYNQPPQQQEVPLGAIVGGAIGGLVVLTFSFFLCFSIKYRVTGSQQMESSGSGGEGAGMQSYRSGDSSAARSQVDSKTDRKSGF
ncbi:hypothetical protein BG015_000666 [Linnemannia schmuckeri]|uniref:Uncharacterized protein n=1 Tax=Linnemannia schmuckeri TaxID=64567 RepID=A0A9P5V7A7_9FUNG|nr:hypothetical protein BG015_000666 [Linnemannia schmuckeri]